MTKKRKISKPPMYAEDVCDTVLRAFGHRLDLGAPSHRDAVSRVSIHLNLPRDAARART